MGHTCSASAAAGVPQFPLLTLQAVIAASVTSFTSDPQDVRWNALKTPCHISRNHLHVLCRTLMYCVQQH